jgi:hypothetical protein
LGNVPSWLITTLQASIQNSKDILDLQKHITKLTRIFQRWSGARELPAELKTRIATFVEWVHIPLSHIWIYHCLNPQVTSLVFQPSFTISHHTVLFAASFQRQMMPLNYPDSSATSIDSSRPSRYQCHLTVTVNYLIHLGLQLDGIVAIEVAVNVGVQL